MRLQLLILHPVSGDWQRASIPLRTNAAKEWVTRVKNAQSHPCGKVIIRGRPFSTLPVSSCSQLSCDPSHTAAAAVQVCSLPKTLAPPPENAVPCTSPTVGQRTHTVAAYGGARTMRKLQLFVVIGLMATLVSTAAVACPAGTRPCGERSQLCCPAR
jgi:hypothetical protein